MGPKIFSFPFFGERRHLGGRRAMSAFGRPGQPAEIAAVVAFLAGEAAG